MSLIKILNLGAGVQSTTVLLMSLDGILPPLDYAIFADTQWEPRAVYDHLEYLRARCEAAGVPLITVTAGDIRADCIDRQANLSERTKRFASMPFYTRCPQSGSLGIVRRQCTTEYKIEPIQKYVRTHVLNLAPRQRSPRKPVIEKWFGISTDESQRMRTSREPWAVNQYPLIGHPTQYLPVSMSRQSCIHWLETNYPEISVPRSACIGCPFHSDDEWRSIRDDPAAWADAIEFDAAIRHAQGFDGEVFLHRSCIPLADVDLSTPEDHGQLNWINDCQGMCGV